MRSDRIPLPASESRCDPGHGCAAKQRCARYLAAIPAGATLGDWTVKDGAPQNATCDGLVLLDVLRGEVARQQQRPAAKPWPRDE